MQTTEIPIKFQNGHGIFHLKTKGFRYGVEGVTGQVIRCEVLTPPSEKEIPKDFFIRFNWNTYETNYELLYPMSNQVKDIWDTFANCIRVGEDISPTEIKTSPYIERDKIWKSPMIITTLDKEGVIIPYKEDITIRLVLSYQLKYQGMLKSILGEIFQNEVK